MITSASKPSKIAATVADTLLEIFSGSATVTNEELFAELEAQYAMARKRCTWGSCVQVTSAIERAGVTSYYTGPNYTGDLLYSFPVRWI